MQMADKLLAMLYVTRKLYRLRANGAEEVGLQSISGAPIEPDVSGCFHSCLYLWLGPALDEICFVNKHWRKRQARAAAERPLVERLVIWGTMEEGWKAT